MVALCAWLRSHKTFLLNYIGVDLKMVLRFTHDQARDYILFCAVTRCSIKQELVVAKIKFGDYCLFGLCGPVYVDGENDE